MRTLKRRAIPAALGLALGLGLLAGYAIPQDEAPDQAKMMELWQKYATPGKYHEALGYFVGKWKVTMEMHMDPAAPPQTSKGEAVFDWLMPNRWLRQHYKGTMMGMPTEGYGFTGYDNFKKKYVQVWLDSMNTAMLVGEGVVCDPEGKNIVLYGPMDEWMTGEHDKAVRYATKIVGPDRFEFSIWDLGIGPEGAVVMRMVYDRVK